MPDNDTPKKGWPDLKIGLTFFSALVFLASLSFLSGFSCKAGHNLFGLCDLTDYVRIAPSWGLILLAGFILATLLFWGLEKPTRTVAPDSRLTLIVPDSRLTLVTLLLLAIWRHKEHSLLSWLSVVFLILAIVFSFGQLLVPGLAFVATFCWSFPILFVSVKFLPGWADWCEYWFGSRSRFVRLIPMTLYLLAVAFFWGYYFLPISGSLGSQNFRTITMKDHSKYEGRVVLELNRYVVVLTQIPHTTSGKLTALQSSEIETMDLRPYWSR
jgi:hypothetical protein